ncbi:hypothetical protein [Desulfofustis limnaeus]|jgi:predicted hotdog family 3-hydroxylacyl-ACP dehydratase|uniref:3-hydroxylacyl-ACP dehydratase n=1 Tax=Desulfofustis limnaeus TaxID=2740163 RepID=A0ABM7W5W3_9BACT|nr:hypothetical protein [Desulfofustis limnaeus]MDX9895131.1 hypothetical protein [Desulfofustis sp.]BDD86298.1 hypothetical protein DPPLL_06630 [Desulfofustis limnaeus]
MGRLSDLGLSLTDLLPHREPMVLVEEILEVDRTVAQTRSTVRTSWPLAESDGVQPLVLIELAAQTAGVCNGWDRINTKGPDSEKMGYLVGVKRARLPEELLGYGQRLLVRAENKHDFGNLREVFCTVSREDEVIAEITLQLFQA